MNRSGEDVTVLLKSTPIHDLTYSTTIFHHEASEWIRTNKLQNDSTIVLSTALPDFLHSESYQLNGVVLFKRFSESFQMALPEIKLSVHDFHENQYKTKIDDVIRGQEEVYLTLIVTSTVTPVRIRLPDGIYRTLDRLLQLECNFNRINVEGKKYMYLFDGDNEMLTGSMLRNLDGTNLELYTRDAQQLNYLLHHIHKNIPDVVIYDEECEPPKETFDVSMLTLPTQSFLADPNPVDKENFDNFFDSLDTQLRIIERSFNETKHMNREQYKQFRKMLNICEKETDRLYTKLK